MGFFDKLFGTAQDGKAEASAVNDAPAEQESIRFGNKVPYNDNTYGMPVSLEIRFSGSADVAVCNADVFKSLGGFDRLRNILENEMIAESSLAFRRCSFEGIPVSKLPAKQGEAAQAVKAALAKKWEPQYGVTVSELRYVSVSMTEESLKTYNEIRNMMLSQSQN